MLETISDSMLGDCASQILETMFFANVSAEAGQPAVPTGPMLGALVMFAGPRCGSLAIAIEIETAKTLAVDFLGLSSQEHLDPEKIEDTLGELANMVCGSALSRYDDEGIFSLAHPTCGPHAVVQAMTGRGRLILDIGDGALALCLKFESAG